MNRLGIELLCVFGMNPAEQVELAADMGCAFISTGLTQLPFNPHGYAPWSLQDDAGLRREVIAVMRDRGISISLGEGFTIRPGFNMADRAKEMDIMAELGAACLGASSMEPDVARMQDELALFAEMAGARGLQATIELVPISPVNDLAAGLALVRHVNRPNFRLLIDSMHFFRSGGTAAELAALGPALVGYAQLCDAPLPATQPDYMREAMFGRLVPGQGDLPLAAFLAALPPETPIGLEVPMLAQAQAGVSPRQRLQPVVDAAKALLYALPAAKPAQ
jgi:sugar phosphate isomerase/epimerase